mgnify:FL=1
MLFIGLILIFSFIIASTGFIKKNILKSCSINQLIYIEGLFYLFIFLLGTFYLMYTKKKNFIKNVPYKTFCYILISNIITITGILVYYHLIETYNITKIVPILEPLIIIFTLLMGFYLFNEVITKKEIIGMLVIIIGIIISMYK